MKKKNYFSHSVCINICSSCNLKCDWCYKQYDKKGFLSFNDFIDFYNTLIAQNINKITLIGGEPTIHPEFISILNILSNKQVYLTTNGLMFSQQNFLNDCIMTRKNINGCSTGLQAISISLKGYDDLSFFSTTKTKAFDTLCHAINNLKNCDIPITYSYTFSNDILLKDIEKFLNFLINYGIYSIIINDTRPYISKNTIIHPNMVKNLDKLIYTLETNGITTYFRPNHPLCEYDAEFINFMFNNKKLISNCAIKTNNRYFFSHSLELILCNELYSIVLGKYKSDFNNYEELNNLYNLQYIQNFYQKLSGYPQSKCVRCGIWHICGGNCILHWIKEEVK